MMRQTWRRILNLFVTPALLLSTGLLARAAVTHRVAPGDTLFLVAQRYGTTVDELMRQNGLVGTTIYPDQTLVVPRSSQSSGSYNVQPGDSLFLIATRYGVSVDALMTANGMTSDYLEAGRRLAIPSGDQGGPGGDDYTVRPGDTLYLIASRYATTVPALMRINGLTGTQIYPGQRLALPTGGTAGQDGQLYTVQPGDTLYLLALRFNLSIQAIRQVNGLSSDTIYPGQVLRLSTGGGQKPPPPGISQSDLDLLARLVSAEADGEPYAGQVAVAATVLNRLRDSKYPGTIPAVIYQYSDGAYQYTPVMDGRIDVPASSMAVAAVQDALNGWDPSYGATGFYNPAKTDNPWVRAQPVTTVIGEHVFFRY